MTERLVAFDVAESRKRCNDFRLRILDLSQKVGTLHIAPAFSCMEILDAAYFGLMDHKPKDGSDPDRFVLSKGHGAAALYLILEKLGVLSTEQLEGYCTKHGILGAHPDIEIPGVEASTGSLGHGLGISAGMAYADKLKGSTQQTYVMISDGELQEGSTWEAILIAPMLKLGNLVLFVDNNDSQSLGRPSIDMPHFHPVDKKFNEFGWETVMVDGHDTAAMVDAVKGRKGDKPFCVVANTVKGQGVSYMQDSPIWHYRSPNKEELEIAYRELGAVRR